jgi:hypothetical protein
MQDSYCITRNLAKIRENLAYALQGLHSAVLEGVRRIEEVLTGNVKGLTEAQFRAARE